MSQATQTTPIGAPVEEPVVPVSRPRFMFAFVVLYMLFLLDFSARLGVTSVFPAMQKALGLTDSQIGVAGSAVLCGMTLFVLPLSFIADKTSKKKAITLMSGLWGVGCLLCGLVSNFFLILLGRFMVGMGNASYAPVSVSMLTSWTKKSRWGSVIGLYNSSMSVGLAAGTAVAGILAQSIGWRAPFIVMGVVTLLFMALSMALPKTSAKPENAKKDDVSLKEAFGVTLKNKTLVMLGIGVGLGNMVYSSMVAWIPMFLVREMGWTSAEVGAYMSPVYLFTGFLEAGKTKFIQETLEDNRFHKGERTLLLLCEEGEEVYEPDKFCAGNVYVRNIDEESDLTVEHLKALQDEIQPERVLVEYNGMWMLDSLYGNLPEGWAVAQEFLFCDATSFLSYNANMRQLTVDKLKSAELVVLNRYNDSMDRMEMHRVIRAISRRCDIAYEYTDGKVVYDDIEDPLPFDIDAPVIEIEDRDFALWYRDMSEEPKKYDGKTIEVKCRCLVRKNVPKGCFIAGRHIMTCCVQDIQFAGVVCVWEHADEIRNDEWAIITARLDYKFHRAYGRKGPVLTVLSVQEVEKPEEPVATFY